MLHIRNKNGSMAVTFGNDKRTEIRNPGFCGVVSQISWDNAFAMAGFRIMFGCKEDEIITAIEVDNYGIKAQFKRI